MKKQELIELLEEMIDCKFVVADSFEKDGEKELASYVRNEASTIMKITVMLKNEKHFKEMQKIYGTKKEAK